MATTNPGAAQVEVTELLAALVAAEHQALQRAAPRSRDYRAGVSDGFASVQALIRKQAGWPLEQDTPLTDS